MKLQMVLLACNSQDTILAMLKSYITSVDRFMVFINNCSDNTRQIIEQFKEAYGVNLTLTDIVFTNFASTRNIALELSNDPKYGWTIFPDDSYELVTSSVKTNVLKNELKSLSKKIRVCDIAITRNGISYTSSRIFRTDSGARYVNKIHEVLTLGPDYTIKSAVINDIPCESQKQRTHDRVFSDLALLANDYDPRSLYYKACINLQLFQRGLRSNDEVIETFKDRIYCAEGSFDKEEIFQCYIYLGYLYKAKVDKIRSYISAAMAYEQRCGEAYFCIYLLTDSEFYLLKAYANKLGHHRLPVDMELYEIHIPRHYIHYLRKKVFCKLLLARPEVV